MGRINKAKERILSLINWRGMPFLLSFAVPVMIMLSVIMYKGIYPFGDRSFLRVDMYNQYMPFFTEFHRKLREGGSLLFSWHAGLGSNFMALYAYYLASPMNWLLLLCPEEYIIEFMTVLIVVKIGLCGLFFSWYLSRHFQVRDYRVTLFAIFYALSGFMAAYNWNIMWLDCIFLAPLIILGLEKLVYEKKYFLYAITLGLSILSNYYISIFICIFLVLYFLILVWELPIREKLRCAGAFTLYSLLAAGLAGIVFLPAAFALRSTRYDNFNFPKSVTFYFSVVEMLARHCVNVATEIRNDHWPNIYCGAAVFFLLPLYVMNRKISWKRKLPRLLLLGFFLLSFSMNMLNYIWHGFNYPNSLPCRQSFLYIFLVLVLCFEALLHIKESSRLELLAALSGAVGFIYVCSRLVEHDDFKPSSYVLTMMYVLVYGLLVYWHRDGSVRGRLLPLLALCLVVAETGMNTVETSVATTSRSKYRSDFETNQDLLRTLEKRENEFYRIEQFGRMTKNDGMLAGFPTATMFSSTTNEATANYYKRLGMSTSKVFYAHEGATPLTSALLSVKYMFSDSLEITDDFHELIDTKKGEYLYRNRYCLPLGFMVSDKLAEEWDLEQGNPIDVQNSLAKLLGVHEPLYRPLDVEIKDGKAGISIRDNSYVYAYVKKSSEKDVKADINGYEKTFKKVNYPHILDLGWCDAGTEVTVELYGSTAGKKKKLELSAYELNEDSLRKAVHKLNSQPMKIDSYDDTRIKGHIEVSTPGLLATSIPYEAGWKARVDGREAEIVSFGGAMIGLLLTEGEHTIELTFSPPGLYAGMALSLLSVIILVYAALRRRRGTTR